MTLKVLLRRAIYGFPCFKQGLQKRLAAYLKRPSLEERLKRCELECKRLTIEMIALERQANASCHHAAGAATDCPPLPHQ